MHRNRRRQWTLRGAIVAVLAVSAVPASAAVLMANFMKVNISRNSACVTKIAGLDTSTTIAVANTANTGSGTGGVNLLNEKLAFTPYVGNRTIAVDSMRIKNACGVPMKVYLKAENGIIGSTVSGDWTALTASVYLGADPIVSAGTLNPALSATDFSNAVDWDQAPIKITAGTTGTVSNAQTGTVTIPAGQEVQLGVFADAGSTALAAGNTTSINFTVVATQ